MAQSKALDNSQIIRAALVVLVGFLASGVLGFVRTGVIAAQFGAGTALDSFLAAQRLPEIIFVLVAGGALGSSFIPIYAKQRDISEDDAWQLASATLTLSALAAGILSLLVIIFAPFIVANFLRPAASIEEQALIVSLMRIMMVTPFIFAISGLVMGILQSHGLFLLPSLAISMNSIGIIIGAFFIAPYLPEANSIAHVGNNNVYGLAIGAVLSAVLHLVVQLPGLRSVRAKLSILPSLAVEGVRDVMRLMLPRILGLGVVQVNFLVNSALTSDMIEGSYSALTIAFTIMFFALGIIGQSVGSAIFPTLSALYAEDKMDAFKERLASAMRSVLFLSFPATVAFIIMGEPIVSILEFGEWTSEQTQATAWALAFYATGIAGFALLEILSRAFYALSDTWTPVVIGIGAMVSNIILSFIFIQFIGDSGSFIRGPFAGLALANALTTLVEALILWWLMRRRIGDIRDGYIWAGSWRAIVAALVMGGILWLFRTQIPLEGIILAIMGAGLGAVVFFGISIVLGLEEAKAVPMMLIRRLRR